MKLQVEINENFRRTTPVCRTMAKPISWRTDNEGRVDNVIIRELLRFIEHRDKGKNPSFLLGG